MHVRLKPPFWRHDAYTLNSLVAGLRPAIARLIGAGTLRRDSTVIDLGAGDAPYRPLFVPHVAHYLACDIAPAPHIDIVFKPGEKIDQPDGVADCVVSFQVLEHVWDIAAYLAECRRLLAPGGRLLLSTHRVWLYHPHPTDFRRWTCDGLRRELEANGFEVVASTPMVGPLAWTTQFRTFAYHHVLSRLGLPGRVLAAVLCAGMHLRMIVEDAVTPAYLRETNSAIYLLEARPRDAG